MHDCYCSVPRAIARNRCLSARIERDNIRHEWFRCQRDRFADLVLAGDSETSGETKKVRDSHDRTDRDQRSYKNDDFLLHQQHFLGKMHLRHLEDENFRQ